MKVTKLIGLVVMMSSIGCATMTPEAEAVRVTYNPVATQGCKYIGDLAVTNMWSPGDTENRLRVEAAKVGANTVYVVPRGVRFSGEAYRCPAAPEGAK